MFTRKRTTMAVALLAAASLTAAATPSFAYSNQYCKDYARNAADHGGMAISPIVPLVLLGTGAGAIAGVAIGGLAVTTGALIGGGSGLAIGAAADHDHAWHKDYDDAYSKCRSSK